MPEDRKTLFHDMGASAGLEVGRAAQLHRVAPVIIESLLCNGTPRRSCDVCSEGGWSRVVDAVEIGRQVENRFSFAEVSMRRARSKEWLGKRNSTMNENLATASPLRLDNEC